MKAPSRGSRIWRPEELLDELVIEKPQDIDLELIALYCGAKVRYAPLSGCVAKLVGFRDKAIITVDKRSHPHRQRFSIGHELGHWMYDRGSAAFECAPRSFFEEWTSNNPETRANRFASGLLMPEALFQKTASELPLSWSAIRTLAHKFSTSLTATAFRLVELSADRPLLLCACRQGRRTWFVRSPGLSPRLFPLEWPASAAVSRVVRGQRPGSAETVGSNLWFDVPQARERALFEDTIAIESGFQESLSLLSWPNVRTVCLGGEDDTEACWWEDVDD